MSQYAQKSELSNPIRGTINANFLKYHSENSHFFVAQRLLKNKQYSPFKCDLRREVRA